MFLSTGVMISRTQAEFSNPSETHSHLLLRLFPFLVDSKKKINRHTISSIARDIGCERLSLSRAQGFETVHVQLSVGKRSVDAHVFVRLEKQS